MDDREERDTGSDEQGGLADEHDQRAEQRDADADRRATVTRPLAKPATTASKQH